MKETLKKDILELFAQGKRFVSLEIEYAKLTLSEKFTILFSAMVIGMVTLLLGVVVLILLSFSLVELFKLMMAPALAYLTVSGIISLLIFGFYLLRKPLLINPLARFISKLILDKR